MLSIQLTGFETPGMLRAVQSALHTYVDGAAEEYKTRLSDFNSTFDGEQGASNVAPAAAAAAEVPAAAAAEAVAPEKATRKKRAAAAEVVTEPAETATADQSAVIAEARALDEVDIVLDILAHVVGRSQDSGKPADEVKIEEIRAVAKLFNTDELREIALEILRKHEVASVTALAERDNIIRVSALADFQAAATQHNLS